MVLAAPVVVPAGPVVVLAELAEPVVVLAVLAEPVAVLVLVVVVLAELVVALAEPAGPEVRRPPRLPRPTRRD